MLVAIFALPIRRTENGMAIQRVRRAAAAD